MNSIWFCLLNIVNEYIDNYWKYSNVDHVTTDVIQSLDLSGHSLTHCSIFFGSLLSLDLHNDHIIDRQFIRIYFRVHALPTTRWSLLTTWGCGHSPRLHVVSALDHTQRRATRPQPAAASTRGRSGRTSQGCYPGVLSVNLFVYSVHCSGQRHVESRGQPHHTDVRGTAGSGSCTALAILDASSDVKLGNNITPITITERTLHYSYLR